MKYVIIGASAAGIAAAKKIRQRDNLGEITVISRDDRIYSRVRLHQFLSGEKDAQGIGFIPADFFQTNSITWKKGVSVTKIDIKNKQVFLENETTVPYDKLLIASGADAFIPPIPHFREASNVFGLRTIFEAESIIKMAQSGKKCVVVGSGLVGLDAATALVQRGVEVTLIEMAERLSPLQLDNKAALAYQQLFEEHGCDFYFSVKAVDTQIDKNGDVTALVLEDGRIIPCDFMIIATGVRPSISFLKDSGIIADRGVAVDAHLCTNIPDVYAAGDAAGIIGFWMGASKQGEIAGENMAGGDVTYKKEEPRNSLNYYGLSTVCIGGAISHEGDIAIFEDGRNYRRILTRDGKTVQVLLQGDISKAMAWQKAVAENAPPLA